MILCCTEKVLEGLAIGWSASNVVLQNVKIMHIFKMNYESKGAR
jgi:hypothetical protein